MTIDVAEDASAARGPKALCKMLRYAGFSSLESRGALQMEYENGAMWVTSAVARV